MLAFRNIKRSFLFQRSFNKVIKGKLKMEMNDVYLLYAIMEMGGMNSFVLVADIAKLMKRAHRSQNSQGLYLSLDSLTIKGYLVKSTSSIKSYKLAVDGVNLLNDLELKARKERWDR